MGKVEAEGGKQEAVPAVSGDGELSRDRGTGRRPNCTDGGGGPQSSVLGLAEELGIPVLSPHSLSSAISHNTGPLGKRCSHPVRLLSPVHST